MHLVETNLCSYAQAVCQAVFIDIAAFFKAFILEVDRFLFGKELHLHGEQSGILLVHYCTNPFRPSAFGSR